MDIRNQFNAIITVYIVMEDEKNGTHIKGWKFAKKFILFTEKIISNIQIYLQISPN